MLLRESVGIGSSNQLVAPSRVHSGLEPVLNSLGFIEQKTHLWGYDGFLSDQFLG